MASPHAKGASRSVRFSDTREYASRPDPPTSGPEPQSDTSEDEISENEADVKLLPLKSRDPTSSSSSSRNPASIDVPDNERDTSKRIEELLAADRNFLTDAFDTDLEDGDSRPSVSLSDDYGLPSDKRLLLERAGGDDDKRFHWRSLFRLHSWWNVLAMLTIAIVVVWLAIRGLPWSSTEGRLSGSVGYPFVDRILSISPKFQRLTIAGNGSMVPYTSRWN